MVKRNDKRSLSVPFEKIQEQLPKTEH